MRQAGWRRKTYSIFQFEVVADRRVKAFPFSHQRLRLPISRCQGVNVSTKNVAGKICFNKFGGENPVPIMEKSTG